MAPLESYSGTTTLLKRRSMTSDSGGGGGGGGGNDHHLPPTLLPLYTASRSLDSMYEENDSDEVSSTCSSRPQSNSAMSILKSHMSSAHSISNDSLPLWKNPQRRALHEELSQQTSSPTNTIQEHNQLVFTARKRKNPLYLAVLIFTAFGLFLYSKSHATLHNALEQVTRIAEQRRQVHVQFANVERDIRHLQDELVSLHNEGGEDGGLDGDGHMMLPSDTAGRESVVDEMVALQDKLRNGNIQITSLQRHLQEVSRRDAGTKYGTGVIRVELELEFPDGKDGPTAIVMEMAPLDLMPHSVYIFLEMVHEGLFDGCSFILNAMHVIKAAPLPYDGSSASVKVKAFTKRGLESVAFREYSVDYPHEQYTVGFAADGSPSFYINTQDNTDIHVGDPCFAKIVSGVPTVQRLEASPTRNGIWYRQRIGLKRATVL